MDFVLDFSQQGDTGQSLLACFQEALGHQLPNRLVAVQGLARLLEEESAGGDEGRAVVGRIATLSEETHRLVRTLAEIGRLCRDARSPPAGDPVEAAREAGATLAVLFPGAILGYDFPEGLPAVIASQLSLSRALLELLRNAAQASPTPVPIEVGGRATAEAVEVWVADRGRGLPEGPAGRLFEPFHRGGTSSGPGLGLFLVRQLVACWRGVLLVHSEAQQGSRFTLRIPRLS
jgi:two-component system sensor histidine kinase KdpD